MHPKLSLVAAFALWSLTTSAWTYQEAIGRRHEGATPPKAPMEPRKPLEERAEKFKFLSNSTKPFVIDSLPEVNFDIGELYSGSVPITSDDPSRTLFFVFAPTTGDHVEEVTIWLGGGPGCSSLGGFFQGNGPMAWLPGTVAPFQNPYTWVNLTNILWVDQPVGTSFSQGNITATTQDEIAQDFISFFKNWQSIFGIKDYNIYVTGESYAGRYVPYIAAAMLDQNDTTYYDVAGAMLYDPVIGNIFAIQEEVVAVPFFEENNNILNLNDSFMQQLRGLHQSCGYSSYLDTYLTFPASSVQPPIYWNNSDPKNISCDVFNMGLNAATEVNPCFNVFEIVDVCPIAADPLGYPTLLMQNQYSMPYFNRSDVKEAIHAPMDVDWIECVTPVFVAGPVIDGEYLGGPEAQGDLSPDPIQSVLPQVIEATNRVLVTNGDFDMIILTNGTLLSIQNMTWNGKLGFQEQPSTPINIPIPDLVYQQLYDANGMNGSGGNGQGVMGIQHYERGLMWAETFQSGHEQLQYQPRASYRYLQWLLGRIDEI